MQALVPQNEKDRDAFIKLSDKRRILILGSTGSIGKSALEVIEKNPEHFEVIGLVALGSKPQVFAEQIRKFKPRFALVVDQNKADQVRQLIDTEILAGESALIDLCKHESVDLVLAAVVGASGLAPVFAALEAKKIIALANKESLVVGGSLVRQISAKSGSKLLPVDSEHSALFQALIGVPYEDIRSLTLTASGGPFLRKSLKELTAVTVEQAIKHPRWQMGPKISVDSATLMNKALELIEAYYLFGTPADKLSAVIHPQSIVHAIVNFNDGASIFQASVPDMKEPIAYALNYPKSRLLSVVPSLDLAQIGKLEFEQVDSDRFPAVKLALESIKQGSIACITLNQANEYAVAAFIEGRLRFVDIVHFVEEILSQLPIATINSLEDIFHLQAEIQRKCDFVIKNFNVV